MADNYTQISREWWVEQWLGLLDSYRFKKRLERARVYAREGNVRSIEFQGQKVFARVQGTEVEPYQVSIWLDAFSDEEWQYAIETMSEKAIYSAKLLAGEMPANIEKVFTANGLSLFPFKLDDVRSKCSCPDKANPCKHIGAVYYLLADRFGEDPFVLFQLRGRTKEQILETLRQMRSRGTEKQKSGGETQIPKLQYPLKVEHFWQYDEPLESSLVVIVPPPSSETVLDVLGTIPLANDATENADAKTTASETVMKYLNTVYQAVSQQAIVSAMKVGE
ncbi:SWIM zinc finger family protein [Planktothrix sp. FACHB-1355]|uniref:SWIM zinc finger family protein n=1 Tax=Aerosakkonema funiforme FACHB-1375 TaxID=2949571 RepID=A0A926VI85_9CYAN|nr:MULTISPECIES: SWIM zinc finger family protein [Oscillatoriales]MBD2184366.1 SWIM zinc finger family protein [Aerosakkonema funiforme FACHB-1375]MBD3558836.1 SWIM zinc finger family protein [Planktothrix sp. FACHB-1355]